MKRQLLLLSALALGLAACTPPATGETSSSAESDGGSGATTSQSASSTSSSSSTSSTSSSEVPPTPTPVIPTAAEILSELTSPEGLSYRGTYTEKGEYVDTQYSQYNWASTLTIFAHIGDDVFYNYSLGGEESYEFHFVPYALGETAVIAATPTVDRYNQVAYSPAVYDVDDNQSPIYLEWERLGNPFLELTAEDLVLEGGAYHVELTSSVLQSHFGYTLTMYGDLLPSELLITYDEEGHVDEVSFVIKPATVPDSEGDEFVLTRTFTMSLAPEVAELVPEIGVLPDGPTEIDAVLEELAAGNYTVTLTDSLYLTETPETASTGNLVATPDNVYYDLYNGETTDMAGYYVPTAGKIAPYVVSNGVATGGEPRDGQILGYILPPMDTSSAFYEKKAEGSYGLVDGVSSDLLIGYLSFNDPSYPIAMYFDYMDPTTYTLTINADGSLQIDYDWTLDYYGYLFPGHTTAVVSLIGETAPKYPSADIVPWAAPASYEEWDESFVTASKPYLLGEIGKLPYLLYLDGLTGAGDYQIDQLTGNLLLAVEVREEATGDAVLAKAKELLRAAGWTLSENAATIDVAAGTLGLELSIDAATGTLLIAIHRAEVANNAITTFLHEKFDESINMTVSIELSEQIYLDETLSPDYLLATTDGTIDLAITDTAVMATTTGEMITSSGATSVTSTELALEKSDGLYLYYDQAGTGDYLLAGIAPGDGLADYYYTMADVRPYFDDVLIDEEGNIEFLDLYGENYFYSIIGQYGLFASGYANDAYEVGEPTLVYDEAAGTITLEAIFFCMVEIDDGVYVYDLVEVKAVISDIGTTTVDVPSDLPTEVPPQA